MNIYDQIKVLGEIIRRNTKMVIRFLGNNHETFVKTFLVV